MMNVQIKPISWLMTIALCFSLTLSYAQDTPSEIIAVTPSVEPVAAAATPAIPVGPTTEITFDESEIEFGEIQEGTIVTQVFTFTNTGDEVLIISDVKGSCGCTVPEWPRAPIAIGETASITVEFNSKNKKGKRNQRVTITANTVVPQTFIYLKGSIVPAEDTDYSVSDPIETEIEEVNPNCFAIYPNPTAELLRLDMEGSIGEAAIITIYAKSGQLMAKREVEQIEGELEFQVGHYPAGTYIANVQIAGKKAEARCFVVVD